MLKTAPHQIIRSRRKTIMLQITPDAKLVVYAPTMIPNFFIDRFLEEKKDWIEKKLSEIRSRPQVKKKLYAPGDEFFYLGKRLVLAESSDISISVKNDQLLFPKALMFRVQKELEIWFISQAKEIITQRLQYHAEKMKSTYTSVFFSNTKSKWGTCFHDNSLQFNWRLVMAPLLVIDYVIIHELVHTTEKNHSATFWNKVRLFTPAYRQHLDWLTKNGHLLLI